MKALLPPVYHKEAADGKGKTPFRLRSLSVFRKLSPAAGTELKKFSGLDYFGPTQTDPACGIIKKIRAEVTGPPANTKEVQA